MWAGILHTASIKKRSEGQNTEQWDARIERLAMGNKYVHAGDSLPAYVVVCNADHDVPRYPTPRSDALNMIVWLT